jgi:ParB family chromosome partitioning protein
MRKCVHMESLEIGQLDLRYAHTRIRRPEALLPLMRSLEKWGQLRPVIVIRLDPPCHVLVDGYLRVEALRRCGKDTVLAEVWFCSEMEALLQVLMREQERRWEALEEASLIRELHERHELSQDKIARLLGKDKSWVCRRLSLLCSLPEEVLDALRGGHLSPWTAGRVLVPLARANPEHAKALVRTLSQEHLSTRNLEKLFRHYQRANRKQRERMVLDPVLFLKALRAKEEESLTRSLKDGPEGKWLRDMKTAGHILSRLAKALPSVIYPGQQNFDRRLLLTAFEDARSAFLLLQRRIERRFHNYAEPGHCAGHPGPEGEGSGDQGDLPHSPCLPKHGSKGASGEGTSQAPESFPL